MYITIERAHELVLASKTLQRGPQVAREFKWLTKAREYFAGELQKEIDLAYLADKKELHEGIRNKSLPEWVYEAMDIDQYYAYDIGINLSKTKRQREEAVKKASPLLALIEECNQGRDERIPMLNLPKSVVLDEIDGFVARVADAEDQEKSTISIHQLLYQTLVAVEARSGRMKIR